MKREFEVGNQKFNLIKINPFKQFHIARRIGPVLAEIVPAMKVAGKGQEIDNLTEVEKLDLIAKFATPVFNGLAKLSDVDADFVLLGLLAGVEVQQQPTGNWAPVSNGSVLLMQNFELPLMLQLAGRSFMFNLSGFFAALPQK